MVDREGALKLEKLLIKAAKQALREGKIIVDKRFHPTDNCMCPVYAACYQDQEDALKSLMPGKPLYEDIISRKIGQAFTNHDFRSYLSGFDTEEPYDHPIFDKDIQRNPEVFAVGRRLRERFITKIRKETWKDKFSDAVNWLKNACSLTNNSSN